jgi:hypothetical protein
MKAHLQRHLGECYIPLAGPLWARCREKRIAKLR